MDFDRLAPHYGWLEAAAAGQLMQRARTHWLGDLAGQRRILSVGEGHGRFAAALLQRFPSTHLTCVDASAEMLVRARRRVNQTCETMAGGPLDVTWIHATLPEWRPAARSFDTIVTCFALDCLSPDWLGEVVPVLAAGATTEATWLNVDFAMPASGPARWRARAIEALLYGFFRRTAAIPAAAFHDVAPLLEAEGFTRRRHRAFSAGLIHADVWRRTPAARCHPTG